MTLKQIKEAQVKANVPYELAKQIRVLLDEARAKYGAGQWEEDAIEEKAIELVTEEGDVK